ncbi:transcriptional regulator, MarR family [Frankia casuarinae]|uniref:MarR family winged helix-turn-helix transcriptional regulator n=1 Tax=unclassified Frankia TaxID=2632575 RepID=UPI0002DBF941|nr:MULTISPECIES: MarR family transcriptional regulator [Frankia]ETA01365.1 transcriptional regulator, MarR family [Frankia sp. CcI6]EYT89989.1 transcriptional regulator, MarR family [Frankia casuarinae]KDA42531.1 transcriptional regulator, MarR family [Frankia sp. BMG5.23]OAA23108.1 transcriptional regulator [Frankia casuarinae]
MVVQLRLERDARALTEVVTRLRRVLRTSIRSDYPWEALPMAQVELLQCLQERDGARVGELAGLLHLAPNTVSTLVQQMSDADLLRRVTDPADRRAARVSLTETGTRHLQGWREAHERRLGDALGRLAAADQAVIVEALPALSRLVEQLDDRRPADPSSVATGGP